MYPMDKSGFLSINQRQNRVVEWWKTKTQYKQRSKDCKNVIALVIIYADGFFLPFLIIFKSYNFMTK